MPFETAIALMGFAFVMSISPGPGNVLLLSSGATFGFRRSLPLVFGISFGFLSMVAVLGLGFGQVMHTHSSVVTVLKFACAAYVLYLASKIVRSRAKPSAGGPEVSAPIGFLQAASFQLVNPKAWAVALILPVTYTVPETYLFSLAILIGLFFLVNVPAISIWALAGASLTRFVAHGNRIAWFNGAMAALLVISMAWMLFGTAEFGV
ncbi:LysE family translocator [Jannaschia donghaensis]|uniref:Cysteine/O-acetylserine efflux protein n=1 Tax=Jannaschia donghaensis TaxID=420998 RepID=A0A0M6YDY6_9RHOB|nr:LysE family translocator [Jannaschia donghaensis]CTQ48562.1 Cysteine/O-acetylserine efflux protein [Jannaschia donghaensis]